MQSPNHERSEIYVSVPPELWARIWANCPRPRLCRIALVCRLFRDTVQPLLFHEIVTSCAPDAEYRVASSNWFEITKKMCRVTAMFNTLPHSALGDSVFELTFRGTRNPGFVSPTTRDVEMTVNIGLVKQSFELAMTSFKENLPAFRNLRSLVLYSVVIDETIYAVLEQMKALEDLSIMAIDFDRFCDPPGSLLRLLSVKAMMYDGRERASTPHLLCAPQDVIELDIESSFLLGFSNLGQCCVNLRSLTLARAVSTEDCDDFFRFLHLCPNLKHLNISAVDSDKPCQRVFDPILVPQLTSIHADRAWTRFFAFGRQITAVNFWRSHWYDDGADGWPDLLRTLEILHDAQIPLTQASFWVPTYSVPLLCTTLASFWPQLESLRVSTSDQYGFPRPLRGRPNNPLRLPASPVLDERTVDLTVEWHPAPDVETISRPESPQESSIEDAERDDPDAEEDSFDVNGVRRPRRPKQPARFETLLRNIIDDDFKFPPALKILELSSGHLGSGSISRYRLYPIKLGHDVIKALGNRIPALQRIQLGSTHQSWNRYQGGWSDGGPLI
ncbi:unnamed protein product [Mycena citricolor]|uniref:F-box domain-containing protein n=1 Tax=Mycena citricolor TaxID=2018698 RepID=A0AAD2HTN2_9AGAR|nr:unnamed protein product [Mycena citricolor]